LFSCKSDYDKHLEQFRECSEKKKEEKKYKYSNIQEALNAYDFEVARDYLACHPDDKGDLNNRTFYHEVFGGGDYHLDPKGDDLKKIITAEISFFTSQGEFKKAETTAKEANLMDVYEKISGEGFEDKLDDMIEKKEHKKIYSYLSNKRFDYQKIHYDLTSSPDFDNNYTYQNGVREYNALLDKILSKYVFEEVDNKTINQVINLALPELIEKPWRQVIHSKLSDEYKKEAKLKYLK